MSEQVIDKLFNTASGNEIYRILEQDFGSRQQGEFSLTRLLDHAIAARLEDPTSFAARRALLFVAAHAEEFSALEYKAIEAYRQSCVDTRQTDDWAKRGAIYPYPLLLAYETRDDLLRLPASRRVRQIVLEQFEAALDHLGNKGGKYRDMAIMRCADLTRELQDDTSTDIEHACTSLFQKHLTALKNEEGPTEAVRLLHDGSIKDPGLSTGMIHTVQGAYLDIVMNDLSPAQAAEEISRTAKYHKGSLLSPAAASVENLQTLTFTSFTIN
ncbi:MAG: hypothetical protein H6867_05915 [Rhodospirillales bacterium]|nr:hypothetical protein [Rhodospirillales bacterium]MCB9995064.1 hypothetical protein [Rhodospirillales bacterium]